jgi:asparagine synthetase A
MLIQREQGYDKVGFSLRYRFKEESKAEVFCKKLQEHGYEYQKNQNKNGIFVISLDIETNRLVPDVLQNIHTSLGIIEADFDFFVRFTTEYDHSGIDFPQNVLNLHKTLGGGIGISIICLS